jgi:hypothetical protein
MSERPAFTENYFKINEGLLSFPVAFPGTPLWRAVKAREKLIVVLLAAVRASKARMATGETPACLLDYWMEDYLKDTHPPQEDEEVCSSPAHIIDSHHIQIHILIHHSISIT